MDLGAHGVTVESAADHKLYQGDPELTVSGSGFNNTISLNTLKWGNSLRGKGVNYTITKGVGQCLDVVPEARFCVAVEPGEPAGPLRASSGQRRRRPRAGRAPTEAKKGRTVATIFEDPAITANPSRLSTRPHTPLWVTGARLHEAPTVRSSISTPAASGHRLRHDGLQPDAPLHLVTRWAEVGAEHGHLARRRRRHGRRRVQALPARRRGARRVRRR